MAHRKGEKEALRRQREEREAKARAEQRRKRLVGFGAAGALALAAVVIVFVLVGGGGNGSGPGGGSNVFPEGGEVAETAYVVYSVEPRDGYRSPPQDKPPREPRIGSFRLVFANQQSIAVPLESDVNADYGSQPRTYTHPRSWSPRAPIARTAGRSSS